MNEERNVSQDQARQAPAPSQQERQADLSRRVEAALGKGETAFQRTMARHSLYAPWSGVGDGWVPIVDRLFTDLEAMGWTGAVAQVKEKWGGLEVSLSTNAAPPPRF